MLPALLLITYIFLYSTMTGNNGVADVFFRAAFTARVGNPVRSEPWRSAAPPALPERVYRGFPRLCALSWATASSPSCKTPAVPHRLKAGAPATCPRQFAFPQCTAASGPSLGPFGTVCRRTGRLKALEGRGYSRVAFDPFSQPILLSVHLHQTRSHINTAGVLS